MLRAKAPLFSVNGLLAPPDKATKVAVSQHRQQVRFLVFYATYYAAHSVSQAVKRFAN